MGSAIPRGQLDEIVRAARARTGVPGVAAGLFVDGDVELAADGVLELGRDERVAPETPFRVASITKWFVASLAALCLDLDEPLAAGPTAGELLSHTAGWRVESAAPLPEQARGLWSYSNAAYWTVGAACAEACGGVLAGGMRDRLLEPLGLGVTGFDEPARPARGHVQEGETGHLPVRGDVYAEVRRASGGLWSTVGDLLAFAAHQLGRPGPLAAEERATLRAPRAQALGAAYGLGCWTRPVAGGRTVVDHEGSVGGYQSLLLLLPEEQAALAVLTNSWRGSGLIRRVVDSLGLVPDGPGDAATDDLDVLGRYELGGTVAVVEAAGGGIRLAEAETDPVTGTRIERAPYRLDRLGGGVYGFAGGLLMSHRVDFPRAGVVRAGWTALPRVS
jgi:CubicO group peptidase (beta-lactamase class C family)